MWGSSIQIHTQPTHKQTKNIRSHTATQELNTQARIRRDNIHLHNQTAHPKVNQI